MTTEQRFTLPGSDRHELQPHGVIHPKLHPDERIDLTIRLVDDNIGTVSKVAAWALMVGLKVTDDKPKQSLVKVQGSVEDIEQAFGVELRVRELDGGGTFHAHYGPITVPASMEGVIEGVFGLDNRPVATPRLKKSNWRSCEAVDLESNSVEPRTLWWGDKHPPAFVKPPGTFSPIEVADLYSFPAGDGAGQTVALIELGGGFSTRDLALYWQYLGIVGPTVQAVSVNSARNGIMKSDADGEVMLDIEIVGAVAPKAKIAVYFAANTDKDFLDAISQATHDKVNKNSVIVVCWGGPELSWTPAAMTSMDKIFQEAAALGITVLIASGDNGSSDGIDDGRPHCDFPASSPNVLACGGSRLAGVGSTITSETVWNDIVSGIGSGGGGCSSFFKVGEYQATAGVKCEGFRAVPDVAGCADPETGFVVRVDGSMQVVGGTSATAPLYAGLIARINQIAGKRVGFLNPRLYANPSVCRDIKVGDNGDFSAIPGFDEASGLGSINGAKLLEVLK